MAEAILGSDAPLRKTQSPFLNMSAADIPELPGLVQHPLLCPDTQLRLLAEVDKTGSAELEALVAALPNHAHPATAALALVAAGVLKIEPGLIDGHSVLFRANATKAAANAGGSGTANDAAARNQATPASNAQTPHSSNGDGNGVVRSLRSKSALPGYHDPQIFFARGDQRATLGRHPQLRQPGIYLGAFGASANVGMGSDVGKRVSTGAHLSMLSADDTIFVIVDRNNRLGPGEAKVAERLLARAVEAQGEFKLRNSLPKGEAVNSAAYARIFAFVSDAVLTLRQAGLAFTCGERLALFEAEGADSDRAPETDAGETGQLHELRSCGLLARAVIRDNNWIVLKGSEIRMAVQPSAHGSATQRRAELLHTGALVTEGDRYRLTQDLRFGSATGAGHFVLGCKTKTEIWRPCAPDEASALTPRL